MPIPYKLVSSIIKLYDTDGHRPHLILTEDIEKYVLKGPKYPNDQDSIKKEFICSNILKIWNIPTPDICALILKPELISSEQVKNTKSFGYSKVFFGSGYISSAIDMVKFIDAKGKVSIRKFTNLNQFLEIALFDIWIENEDRRPSNFNLLLSPVSKKFQILPIDHAFAFSSLPFLQLNQNFVNFSDNDSIILSSFGIQVVKQFKIDNNWYTEARKKYYLCIKNTTDRFQEITKQVPEELSLSKSELEILRNFLTNKARNKLVFDHFCYILSIVKK